MRSLCAPFAVVAVLAFATGCEDGPNQPYSPAPAGAASVWTAPQSDAAVGPGASNFDGSFPTTGATTLCSTDLKRQRWAWMLTQPIQPPRFYAGIDLAGGNLWNGLSISAAEAPPSDPNQDGGGLCQSVPLGAGGTCPSGFGACDQNYWGNNQEVGFSWNVATHILDQMTINLGYTGSFSTGQYPDHTGAMHSYAIAPGDVVRRDGEPFLLPWDGNPDQQITDIFNAAMASYASQGGIAWDTSDCTDDSTCAPGEMCQCTHDMTTTTACANGSKGKCGDKNCGTDGFCLVYPGQWIFGVRPLALYVQGTAGVPQPALSTPTGFYNFWVKWEPFSYLAQNVELGPNGPTTYGHPTGATNSSTECNQHVGMTFSDFQQNCVQVHGDKGKPNSVDDVNLNKVLNGLTHDQEHWTANVLGVNQNFTSLKVADNPNIVVQDTDTPQPTDVAQDWTYDIRARGQTDNDYNPGNTGDPSMAGAYEFRASSLIVIEWARLMLADVAKMVGPDPKTGKPHVLGDGCTGFDSSGAPNYLQDKTCSGLEGLIVPGWASTGPLIYGPGYGSGPNCSTSNPAGCHFDFSLDPLRPDLNPASNFDAFAAWWLPIIKPSGITGALCIDPLSQTDCDITVLPQNLASIWQNMLNHVTRVMGNGNVHNLPEELQDPRYYFKWFGVAFAKYLKAYANYRAKYGDKAANSWPDGTVGGGLGPSDVMTQPVDQESLFFDYLFQTGVGQGQTFDKFEYVDRDFIGQGVGGACSGDFALSNCVPWDFEYGSDLLGGNQRYDNWFRRMDREEIALYSAMLEDKTHTPGQENNVNITNLAGSSLLAANWSSWQCATGQYTDPSSCTNPPLDPTGMTPCSAALTCAAGQICVAGVNTWENGALPPVCAPACDAMTACPDTSRQACVTSPVDPNGAAGCVNMKMDRNGAAPCTDATGAPVTCPAPSTVAPHPLLWRYGSSWGHSPFGLGHSPITLKQMDKQAGIGVAKITIPNFAAGPYTPSPVAPTLDANGKASCDMGYNLSSNGIWCNAAVNSGSGTSAPSFTPLTPWLEVGGGETANGGPVGFSIPEDGNRDQFLTTGQLDFTGVLESYVIDYVPWTDPVNPSCVSTGKCNPGYNCDPNSNLCVTDDDTIRIEAVEGQDFLGQIFMCQDPFTHDILHMGMYDSAATMVTWLANHPGGIDLTNDVQQPSAQVACAIVLRTSPYDNAIDRVAALSAGANINFSGGQGQGRVTDAVIFDPNLIQNF